MWSCMSFIDALPSMVGYCSFVSFHVIDISMVDWINFLLVDFDGLYMIDYIKLLSYPSGAYQMGFLV